MRAPITVNIADAHLGIWQDNPNDPSFFSEIYGVLIHDMRARGWSLREDPETRRRFNRISPSRRLGARGTLRCEIQITGRVVKVDFWSLTAPQVNPNGRRYDFDKLKRMSHIEQLRVALEFRRITTWLETLAKVTVTRRDEIDLGPMQRIAKRYVECWHTDKTLGRPVCTSDSNRRTKSGDLLEHGQTVWLTDSKGRMIRGTAYYNINNMWWVVAGGKLHNESSHSLFSKQPDNLRIKRNERARRSRLERELSTAIERMNFQRAQTLKGIIFGAEQTFMIWHRSHQAFYGSNYSGYTTDRINAGKYLRAEAEAECRRCPDELEMACPDGSHVRFDRRAA